MENKKFTVSKWVLLLWPKIPQIPQNLSAKFVCPSPKVLDFNEKRLHWTSIVRGWIFSVERFLSYSVAQFRLAGGQPPLTAQYISQDGKLLVPVACFAKLVETGSGHTKGQLISKGLFGFFNSPKKRPKNFCPSRLGQKLTFSSSFFGRIEDTKISFRD